MKFAWKFGCMSYDDSASSPNVPRKKSFFNMHDPATHTTSL